MGNSKGKRSEERTNPFLTPAVITAIIGLVGTLAGLYITYQQITLPIRTTQTAEAKMSVPLPSLTVTPGPTFTPEIVTAPPTPTPLAVSIITPSPGETLILVSKFEPVNTEQRDVSRFIADDLRQRLNLSFSNYSVAEYPEMITNKEQATDVANLNQATIIVWGNYTADFIEVNIQIGNLDRFQHITIKKKDVEEAANLRFRIQDERQESVVQGIISAMIVVQTADSNTYEALRDLAILETIQGNLPEPAAPSVSSFVSKYCVKYVTDPEESLKHIDSALGLNGGNLILYTFRGAVKQKLGDFGGAQQDVNTAIELSANQWASPLLLRANNELFTGDVRASIATMDKVISLNPKDWWSYNLRGSDYFLIGDLSSARADFASAIALEPAANFPYVYSSLVAIHEGRLDDAKMFLGVAMQKSPDPTYGEKIIYAYTGTKTNYPHLDALSSYGRLVLKQYSDAITIADNGIRVIPLPDLYFIKGAAHCNLKQYPEAESAFAEGLKLDKNFGLLYILNADVKIKQGNGEGAQADLLALQSTEQWTGFAGSFQNAPTLPLTCETLFSTSP